MSGIGTRKTNATGRATGRRFTNRRTRIGGQFVALRIEMLESSAWCALSLSARRLLDRIEIEQAAHGGADNGKLRVTYDNFEEYGIDRHAIGPALREAVALGFLEITEAGRAGTAEFRTPNGFRLTFLHATNAAPTDEWRRFESLDAAVATASAARAATAPNPVFSAGNRHQRRKVSVGETPTEKARPKKQISSGGKPTGFSGENPHRERKFPVGETPTTIYISGRGAEDNLGCADPHQAATEHGTAVTPPTAPDIPTPASAKAANGASRDARTRICAAVERPRLNRNDDR